MILILTLLSRRIKGISASRTLKRLLHEKSQFFLVFEINSIMNSGLGERRLSQLDDYDKG